MPSYRSRKPTPVPEQAPMPPTVEIAPGVRMSQATLLHANLLNPKRLIHTKVLEALGGDQGLLQRVADSVLGLCDECYDANMPCDCWYSNPPAGG